MYQTSTKIRTQITQLQFRTSPGSTGQIQTAEEDVSVDALAPEESRYGEELGNKLDPEESYVRVPFADKMR
jgi:hypothetical protein